MNPSTIPIEKEQAGNFFPRFFAWIVDLTLFLFVPVLVCWALSTLWWNAILFILLCPIAYISYCAYADQSPKQGTFGKQKFGLKVVGIDGKPIGFFRAWIRETIRFISLFAFYGALNLWLLTETDDWASQKKGVHDFLAGTKVLRIEKKR